MTQKPLSSIILAAGDGKRLRSQVPKALHQICGRPMIVHILRSIEGLLIKTGCRGRIRQRDAGGCVA